MHFRLSPTTCIECSFREVFFYRRFCTIVIAMELQQALWQLTIVQAFFAKHVCNHSLVFAFFDECIHALAFVQETSVVEGVEESEVMYVGKERLLEVRRGHLVISIEELEHILEHTACSTACRHELGNIMSFCLIVVPSLDVSLCFVFRRSHDAITNSSSSLQFEEVETFAETL